MAAERIGVTVAVTAASKITELLVNPTRHQFRYIFCFHSIVGELRREEKNLTSAHNRVQNEINMALRNAEEIEKDVEEWMTEAKTVMEDVQQLNGEVEIHTHSNKLCSYWIWHYSLSKKVAEKTLNLKKLRERGKFEKVSYHAPVLAIEFLPSKDFTPSKPSREAFNQIFEALKDDNVNMIGLYGMAGVGKTTLAKEVGRKAMVLKLFDQVLMVAMSQAQDTINIQDCQLI